MSNISIKKDFQDGDILPASDLNNNFMVIEAGINANEENLEQVIEEAIIRLDNELIEITANRGWDWNGGDRVTFYKGTTAQVASQIIKNGQLLYNTETGETALDDDGARIVTGSGNVIEIGDEEPENPATKLWINPDEPLESIDTEVINSMGGNETKMAPSVHAVKEYVDDIYSTDEIFIGAYWIDDKPIYRKVFTGKVDPNQNIGVQLPGCSIIRYWGHVKSTYNNWWDIPTYYATAGYTLAPRVSGTKENLVIEHGSYYDSTSDYEIVIEYTKTTD